MVARSAAAPTHTVLVAGRPVLATVTARPAVARRWLCTTRWRFRRHLLRSGAGLTAGLGVQWTPPPFRALPGAGEPRPGTLQLCAGRRCLVLQLARGGRASVLAALRRFLGDARMTFAGYNVVSDCRKLRAHHGLSVASTLELHGGGGMGASASLARMADRLLGIRGVKKAKRWDGETLSKRQVRYACVDAYLSCRLGVEVRRAAMASEGDSE